MNRNKNYYACKINEEQLRQIHEYLTERGYEFNKLPHTHWQAKSRNSSVTAYKNGKLCIQGKKTSELVQFYIEPELLKTFGFGYEDIHKKKEDFKAHGGVDESGKGDYFGPLVISAVFLSEGSYNQLQNLNICDSKLIKNSRKIKELASQIRKNCIGSYTTICISPEKYNILYDKIGNLNKLLAWGHSRAIENILENNPECKMIISDKFANEKHLKNALMQKGKEIKILQRIKAEEDIAVAAASILARESFILSMEGISAELKKEIPKGAGSKVKETARQIYLEKGRECLKKYVKMHFRTTEKIIG